MKGLLHPTGRVFPLKEGNDVHTQYGFVRADDCKSKPGTRVQTNKGIQMTIIDMTFLDHYLRLKRGAQIMTRKDIAFIAAHTGVGKESVVIDAGAGTGAFACFVARWVKKVYTYDIREDHLNLVQKNIESLGIKNVVAKMGDIYTGIKEKNADLLNLDVPEPWQAIATAEKCIKAGGYLVSYSPSITQSAQMANALLVHQSFTYECTVEIIKRDWDIEDRKVRPTTSSIGHTGFLSFARRI